LYVICCAAPPAKHAGDLVRQAQDRGWDTFAVETITAASKAGRLVAVVSNNSAPAIVSYLTRVKVSDQVACVVGRTQGHPERMKPDPDPVLRAAEALSAPITRCLMIGDAPTDIEAARRAGARSIGYAKSPERYSGLEQAGGDTVIGNMWDLASALENLGSNPRSGASRDCGGT